MSDVREAEAIIGRLMTLVIDVEGWISNGKSETAAKAISAARDDAWAATGWRDYHRKMVALAKARS